MGLKNSQYQAIMRQYDLKQFHHRHLLNQRYQEVIARIPAYSTLEEEIASLYAVRARAAVLASTTDRSASSLQTSANTDTVSLSADSEAEITSRIQALQRQQHQLLFDTGYPEDYLDMTYTCPDCHDTGYIGDEKCHCFKQAMVNLLYSQSNIHEVLKKENFSAFNINYYSPQIDRRLGISPRENIQSVISSCKDFIAHFDDTPRNLLFYGDTGVGKTFLTNCIAKELLDTSHTVIYLTAFHLVEILQNNTFGSDDMDDSGENMFDYILDCDLLIIDDLGTEMNNTFVTSQLFLCINERLLSGKSTIISTNLSLDELQNTYSERIFSRLVSNYEILLILGEDIRIKKAIS